jgi:hypothetical protein
MIDDSAWRPPGARNVAIRHQKFTVATTRAGCRGFRASCYRWRHFHAQPLADSGGTSTEGGEEMAKGKNMQKEKKKPKKTKK